MKRCLALVLAVCLLTAQTAAGEAFPGEWQPEEADGALLQQEILAASAMGAGPEIPAKGAILMERTTGKVLFAEHEREPLPPASVTKIMSLLLVLEAMERGELSPETQITCSDHAAAMGGSQIWLEPGEVMTAEELLTAAAVASANDATVALAEAVCGSEEAFVARMNERAAQLGMTDTSYKNAIGLDEEGHLTSARDVALVSCELLRHPRILDYTTLWMAELRGGKSKLVNTNRLVRSYEGITGLKTGTTDKAGKCLAATADRGGMSLVAVVLGCPSSAERFAAGRALLDHGFANYTMYRPEPPEQGLTPVPVSRGVCRSVQPVCEPGPGFVVEKAVLEGITQRVELQENVEAPVRRGQVIGRVAVEGGGRVVGEYPLTAGHDVERMTFSAALGKLWQQLRTMS